MENARSVAVKALVKINLEKAYSNLTVNFLFKNSELSFVDKSLATALVYGVLDRRITLDYLLSKHIKTPIKKVSPITIEALRIALYQIMYMDKIPNSAAVDESVKIVKKSKESKNSGFVNAVLRNILRDNIVLPNGNSLYELSIKYSCPKEIIESLINDYGTDNTKSILEYSLKPSSTIVRVNTFKISIDSFKTLIGQDIVETDVLGAFKLTSGIDIGNNKLYKDGLFYVQDLASQKAISLLNPKRGTRVLDMCAAPGGKSFLMSLLMENEGEIVSCDLYPSRVELIRKSANLLGLNIIKPTVCDAIIYNKELGLFDNILCDVPCSGLGVIGRKPDVKYKNFGEFDELCTIQLSILKNASNYLKKGGRLLYSTCTLRKKENDEIIEHFLENNNDFSCEFSHTFLPHVDGTDGFYAALLIKN